MSIQRLLLDAQSDDTRRHLTVWVRSPLLASRGIPPWSTIGTDGHDRHSRHRLGEFPVMFSPALDADQRRACAGAVDAVLADEAATLAKCQDRVCEWQSEEMDDEEFATSTFLDSIVVGPDPDGGSPRVALMGNATWEEHGVCVVFQDGEVVACGGYDLFDDILQLPDADDLVEEGTERILEQRMLGVTALQRAAQPQRMQAPNEIRMAGMAMVAGLYPAGALILVAGSLELALDLLDGGSWPAIDRSLDHAGERCAGLGEQTVSRNLVTAVRRHLIGLGHPLSMPGAPAPGSTVTSTLEDGQRLALLGQFNQMLEAIQTAAFGLSRGEVEDAAGLLWLHASARVPQVLALTGHDDLVMVVRGAEARGASHPALAWVPVPTVPDR